MNLLENLTNKNLLKSRWNKIYENKNKRVRRQSMGIDRVSIRDFKLKEDEYLNEILQNLESKTFHFNKIKCSTRKKSAGGHRIISEPTVRDRIVHRAIHKLINPIIYPHINTEVSYCGVKKDIDEKYKNNFNIEGAIKEIVRCVGKGNFWIFESDIKGFFDNVQKKRMFKKVIKVLHPDHSLDKLISEIIFYDIGNESELLEKELELPSNVNGISQGSSLSPLFANLFLSRFDKKMKLIYGKRFIRYVDDFVVMCKTEKEAKQARRDVKRFLKVEKLSLSEDSNKTRTVNLINNTDYIKFLGVKINRHRIEPKKNVADLMTWLRTKVLNKDDYETRIIKDKKGNLIGKVSVINQINEVIRGWGNFYSYYHVDSYFEKVDKFIKTFVNGKPFYKDVFYLNQTVRNTIIAEKEWQVLFKKSKK